MFSFLKKFFLLKKDDAQSNLMDSALENVIENNKDYGSITSSSMLNSTFHVEDDFDWQFQQQAIEQHQSFVEQSQRDMQQFE